MQKAYARTPQKAPPRGNSKRVTGRPPVERMLRSTLPDANDESVGDDVESRRCLAG